MKITLEIEEELINYFRENVYDSEPVEILLLKMLKLFRSILKEANK